MVNSFTERKKESSSIIYFDFDIGFIIVIIIVITRHVNLLEGLIMGKKYLF